MKIRNINFRETRSERSATRSYKAFGKYLKERFLKGKGKNKDAL